VRGGLIFKKFANLQLYIEKNRFFVTSGVLKCEEIAAAVRLVIPRLGNTLSGL
jgi:hypothetical protein